MTNPNFTHLVVLLDRSGSMQSIKSDTVGGFAAFIDEQRKAPGRCEVTLAQFDDVYEEVYVGTPLAAVPPLDLKPRGSTALLDAVGRLIVTTGERLAALAEEERPGAVVMVIMTDGLENASREYTWPAVKKLITEQTEQYGWTFVYLGANQDAIAVGQDLGVSPAMSMTYAGKRAHQAMHAAGRNLVSYRAQTAAGESPEAARAAAAFTKNQRDDALG